MNRTLLCIAGLLIAVSLSTKAQSQGPLSLPFEWRNGHIIFHVTVNGTKQLFQLDTGGHLLLSKELHETLDLPIIDSMEIIDSNNKRGYILQTDTVTISFPGCTYTYRGCATLTPEGGWDVGQNGLDGIVGSDVFQPFVLRINARTQQLIIDTQAPQGLPQGYPFSPNKGNLPVFSLPLAENFTAPFLFDTGNYTTLYLGQGVYQWLAQGGYSFEKIENGYGLGMTGMFGGDPRRPLTRVTFKEIPLGGKVLRHVRAEVQPFEIPFWGTGLLQYGEVVIDYPRSMFYFLPFDDIRFEEPISQPEWDIALSLDQYQKIRVAEIWGDLIEKVQVGDYVIAINGKATDSAHLKIGNWQKVELGDANAIVLTIKRQNETFDITAHRE